MELVSPLGVLCRILLSVSVLVADITSVASSSAVATDNGYVDDMPSVAPPTPSSHFDYACRRPIAKITIRCQRLPSQISPNPTEHRSSQVTTVTPAATTTDNAAYSTRQRRNLDGDGHHHLHTSRLTATAGEPGINIEVTPSNDTVVTVYFGIVPPGFSVMVNLYDSTNTTSEHHAAVLIRMTSVTSTAYAGTITFISPSAQGHLHNSTVGFTIPLSPNGAVLTVDVPRDDRRLLHLHERTTKIRLVYLGERTPLTTDGTATDPGWWPRASGGRTTSLQPPRPTSPPVTSRINSTVTTLVNFTLTLPRVTSTSTQFTTSTPTLTSTPTRTTQVDTSTSKSSSKPRSTTGFSKLPSVTETATTVQSTSTNGRSSEFNVTLLTTSSIHPWTSSSSTSTLPLGGLTVSTTATTVGTPLRSSSTAPGHFVTETTATDVDFRPSSTLPSTSSIPGVATETLLPTTHRFFPFSTPPIDKSTSSPPPPSPLHDLTTLDVSTRRTRNETSVTGSPTTSAPIGNGSVTPEVGNSTAATTNSTAIKTPINRTIIETSTIAFNNATNETTAINSTCLCYDWLNFLKTTSRPLPSNVTTFAVTGNGFRSTASTIFNNSLIPPPFTNGTAPENMTSGDWNGTSGLRNSTASNSNRTKTTTEKRNSDDSKWTTFFVTGPTIRTTETSAGTFTKSSTVLVWPTDNQTKHLTTTQSTHLQGQDPQSGNRSTAKPRDETTVGISAAPTSGHKLTSNIGRDSWSVELSMTTEAADVTNKSTFPYSFAEPSSSFSFGTSTQKIIFSTSSAPEVTDRSKPTMIFASNQTLIPILSNVTTTASTITTTVTVRKIAPPSYWIRTVISSEDQELDEAFENEMVVNLQNAYKEAFSRQHLEFLGIIKRNRTPRQTNSELYVEIINATWSESSNGVEIVYFLGHNNSLISTKRAVAAIDLLNDQEVAIYFRHVVILKAEPYLKDPTTEPLSETSTDQSVVLPAVLGSFAALLLIILAAIIIYRCCCRKKLSTSEESLERGQTNRQDRFEEISHSILTVGSPEGVKALSGNPGTSSQRPLPSLIVTPPPIPKRTRPVAASSRPLPELPRDDSYANVHSKRSTSTERLIEETPPIIRRKSNIKRKLPPEEVYRTEYYEVDELDDEPNQPGLLRYLKVPETHTVSSRTNSRAKSPVPSAIEQIAKVSPPSEKPKAKPRKTFRQDANQNGDRNDREQRHLKANTSTQTEIDDEGRRANPGATYNRSMSEPQSPRERELIQAEIQMQTMRERMQDILDDAFTLLKSNKLSPRVRRNRLQPQLASANLFMESDKAYNSLPIRSGSVTDLPSLSHRRQTSETGSVRDVILPHNYGLPRVSWGLADHDDIRHEDHVTHRPPRGSEATAAPPTAAVRNSLVTDVHQQPPSPIYRTRRVVAPSECSATDVYDSPVRRQREPPSSTFAMPASRSASFQNLTPVLGDNEIDVVGRQLRSNRHPDPEAQYLIRTLKEELQKFKNNMEADYSLM